MHIALVPQFNIEYSIQLANALSKLKRVTMILWKNVATEYLKFLDTSVEIEYLMKPPAKNFKNVNLVLDTVRKIEELDPDIVHIQNPYTWMCLGLPFLKGYPIVITVHDPTPHLGREKVHYRLVFKYSLPFSDRVIVHGRRMKELLVEEFGIEAIKVKVIPHGDFSFYTTIASKEFKEEENTILFFGRIWKYKGLEYLIKAEGLISQKFPNSKIIIAGSGKLESYRKLIRNNDRFEIHNEFIPSERIPEFFQRASVVVLPYVEASQTGIIPIAYSFKKPVVVTNVGSLPEVVEEGKTGFVVPPKDHKKLAEAISKLLSDSSMRKAMGENAFMKMKKDLSWERIAEMTVEVYKEII